MYKLYCTMWNIGEVFGENCPIITNSSYESIVNAAVSNGLHSSPEKLYVMNNQILLLLCIIGCFSHSAYWLPTRKTTLHDGQSRSWSPEKKEKRTTEKVWQRSPPHPTPPRCSFGGNSRDASSTGATQISVRLASTRIPSARRLGQRKGVTSQNSTLPCAITTFPVSLLLSSPGDVQPRLPLPSSTRP